MCSINVRIIAHRVAAQRSAEPLGFTSATFCRLLHPAPPHERGGGGSPPPSSQMKPQLFFPTPLHVPAPTSMERHGWGLGSGFRFEGCSNKSVVFLEGLFPNYRLVSKPGREEICVRPISLTCWFYNTNEAHKKYSLSDTNLDYICCFGPPGKHLYFESPKPTTYRPAKPADM